MKLTIFLALAALSVATPEKTTTTEKPQDPCDRAHCSDRCEVQGGKGVCSCTDDRYILNKDGHTCVARECPSWLGKGGNFKCGNKAKCQTTWDPITSKNLPNCYCPRSSFTYNEKDRSCTRNTNFKTCDWPVKHSCEQTCRVKTTRSGSEPVCSCPKSGYSLAKDGKSCTVINQCLVDNKNGGCDQTCKHLAPGKVECSCGILFTLQSDGQKCSEKSCFNNNSGCSNGCTQFTKTDYICFCPRGLRLDSDQQTCYAGSKLTDPTTELPTIIHGTRHYSTNYWTITHEYLQNNLSNINTTINNRLRFVREQYAANKSIEDIHVCLSNSTYNLSTGYLWMVYEIDYFQSYNPVNRQPSFYAADITADTTLKKSSEYRVLDDLKDLANQGAEILMEHVRNMKISPK